MAMVNNNPIRTAQLTSPLIAAFLLLMNIGNFDKISSSEAMTLYSVNIRGSKAGYGV